MTASGSAGCGHPARRARSRGARPGGAWSDTVGRSRAEGSGLGLAISRDLARGMDGDFRVRSEDGQGAAFTVSLARRH